MAVVYSLSGCLGRRYLKEDEHLLIEQKIDGTDGFDKEEIESLYAYSPNRKVLFLPWSPYATLYQTGLKAYDSSRYESKKAKIDRKRKIRIAKTTKEKKIDKINSKANKKTEKQDKKLREGNFFMRMGEPLAIYDSAKENLTVQKLKSYFHTKGYFNAKASYLSESTFKLSSTTYNVAPGEPFVIDSIFQTIPDTAISNLISRHQEYSKITKESIYLQQSLINERERLNSLLLDHGYYAFKRSSINFVVDSTLLGNQRLVVGTIIQNPIGKPKHKAYTLDSVIFTTDADVKGLSQDRLSNSFNKITYQFHEREYSEKILDWRTFLYPSEKYSQSNTLETQKQLSNMDIFKFININYDTTGGYFIANIFTSPLKKYQTSSEIGLNVSKGLPAPFVIASIKNRNTFKGLEVMELSGKAGYEGISGASDADNFYSSLDYGGNLSFTFPQFMLPIGENFKAGLGHLNPKTRLSFGLNYTDRPEYDRSNINTSLAFNWQKNNRKKTYTLNLADINFINSSLTTDYSDLLDSLYDAGNNLKFAFEPSFVSSTWFSVVYNIDDYGNKKKKSSYIRYLVESGGNIFGRIFDNSDTTNNIEFFQFAKFDFDFRQSLPINNQWLVAYRTHVGVAIPYGDKKTLPYEKFFFAGGSNSIRAWEPRRLGPGAYLPIDADGNYSNNLEQTGEILFEASIELRHKLFGFVHGAFFVDVGNLWTINEDQSRPGGQFKFNNFFKEVAVGAGYGLRFDFSFLLLRLDLARKVRDPGSQNIGGTTIERGDLNLPNYKGYEEWVWNLGIGYPF